MVYNKNYKVLGFSKYRLNGKVDDTDFVEFTRILGQITYV